MINPLTEQEWAELVTLKEAITYAPSTVHHDKMERFTELMVKSLEGKGNLASYKSPTNF